MSTTAPDALRKIMLRRFIAEFETRTGQSLTQGKLAEMLGVQQAQISQYVGPERKIPDGRWLDIVRVLEGEDIATEEDYTELRRQLALRGEIHHGQLLREFLKKENIPHKQAAELLKVSPAAVTNFLYSEQFRPELLQKLREIGFLLPDTHTPRNAAFLHSNQKSLIDFENQPLFDLTQIGTEFDLSRTIVVQVDSTDLLPTIRPGARVLAVRMEKRDYKYAKGPTILHFSGQLALGEITHNDLLDKGFITILQREAPLRVLETDIQGLYKIVLSLTTHS